MLREESHLSVFWVSWTMFVSRSYLVGILAYALALDFISSVSVVLQQTVSSLFEAVLRLIVP